MKFLCAVVFACLLSAMLPAQREVDAEGTGATEPLALENALLEAIRQTVGVVSEDRFVARRLSFVQANLHAMCTAGSEDTERVQGVQTATKGMIESYTVLDRQQEGDMVRVSVRAKVATFDPKKLRDEPFSVVLLPIRSKAGSSILDLDGSRSQTELDLKPLAQRLGKTVEQALVQSKVFTMLDRQELGLADAEFARIVAGECAPKDLARLHQRLSADYLLLGEIAEGTAQVEAVSLGNLGWSGRAGHVFALRYTLLEVATGRIARTGTIESREWPDQRKAIPNTNLDLDGLFGHLAERTVPFLVDGFVGDLQPLYVALAKDSGEQRRVTLTQGGSRFAVGDRFEAVQLGETITHPVTGEVLDREETVVGEIEIVDVAGKLAVGEVRSGGDQVTRGTLLRRRLPTGVVIR